MAFNKLSIEIELSKKDIIKGLNLPKKVSPSLAYLCGIFVGDGSIYQRKKKNDYIIKCVGNPKDEKQLYHKIIGPTFKRTFGFELNIRYQDSDTTYGFIIYSKTLFRYLTEVIGLISGKKEQNLCLPEIFKKDESLLIPFLQGIFDTDGCICFKRKYKSKPYYPVISLSSKSKTLVNDISNTLKKFGFQVVETYDYKVPDKRVMNGFTVINRIELNGKENLRKWLSTINFKSPKHLKKIEKYWEG